jgi:hypothetical protein
MESFLLLIFPLLLFSWNAELIAQTAYEGVYLSANDFTNGKISFANNHPDNKYQLHLYEFFNTPSIKISIGDSVITLAKDSIFGYRDNKNTCYRFYKKAAFEILNPSEKILLYCNTSVAGTPRNSHLVTNYYFSVTAGSPIYPLTKENLKAVFGKDFHFHELIDMYFHYDNELTAYDSLNKIYFLNRIYEESNQGLNKINNKQNENENKCTIFRDHCH